MDLAKTCHEGVSALSLCVPTERQSLFLQYLDLLVTWNKTYNLTAIRDPETMLTKHIFDSLSVVPFIHGKTVLDIGTGAGLPGIPVAITRPDIHVTLLDSASKKTRFLTQAIHELKLNNVTVENTRLEKFAPNVCFDTIVSRAFSAIDVMLNGAGHLLCEKGQLLAMKGINPTAELTALPDGFRVVAVHALTVPGVSGERHLVTMEREDHQ